MITYTFNQYGNLIIEGLTNRDIPFKFRNFSGVNRTKFPNPDNKQFSIMITDKDFAQELIAQNWPVRIWTPKSEYDQDVEPSYYLPVKVKFKDRYGQPLKWQPEINIYSAGIRTKVGEEFCTARPGSDSSEFDDTYFESAIVTLRLGQDKNTGKYSAYLARFDGKLAADPIDQATAAWTSEGEKAYY